MFYGYPEMIRDMMNTMFVVDGSPVQPMKKSMMPSVKGVGFMNLFKDVKGSDEGTMSDIKFTVNVDEYLSLNKYEVDESNAHIELVEDPSDEEFDKLILVCPLRCTSVTRMARSLSTTPAAWNAAPAASLVAIPSSRSGKTRSLPWVWKYRFG